MAEFGFAIPWTGPINQTTADAMDAELLRNFEETKARHPELEGYEPELRSGVTQAGAVRAWCVITDG